MDILNRITQHISTLPAGAYWDISAQSLWLSRSDFYSIQAFLNKEAEKGEFYIDQRGTSSSFDSESALRVIKN